MNHTLEIDVQPANMGGSHRCLNSLIGPDCGNCRGCNRPAVLVQRGLCVSCAVSNRANLTEINPRPTTDCDSR